MAENRRKIKDESRPVFHCTRNGCQTFRSVRHGNLFFSYTDLNNKINCKLTLCEILELVYYFVKDLSFDFTKEMTRRFNMCRQVCSSKVSVNRRGHMVGTEVNPVEINEARFAGRRKYNQGRLLNGDEKAESTDSEADVVNNRNYGQRIDGPWVFGLKNSCDCRYFYVAKKYRATLEPIIRREVQEGSVIHPDEWPAYLTLNRYFNHFTVNTSKAILIFKMEHIRKTLNDLG